MSGFPRLWSDRDLPMKARLQELLDQVLPTHPEMATAKLDLWAS
jgi:hypothetical protein